MTTLSIYRPTATLIATINIDERTVFLKKLMGEHRINCDIVSHVVLPILIGDYITYDSENYYINRLPGVVKINNTTWEYSISFEGSIYELGKKLFISTDGLAEYSYNGTPTDFVTNIVASINEISSGWTVGTVDTADEKTLNFSNESCKASLIKIAEAFKMEFEIVGKSISLKTSIGTTTALRFEYGKDMGLYKLTRQQVSDQNIVTKVFGFGGTQNIPYTYRMGQQRLIFETKYLTKNSDVYGVIEGQFTDDEIYPNRTADLTGVLINFDFGDSGYDFNPRTSYVEDSTMDFDINEYLIEGTPVKIVFKSGDLSGVEFEVWKYDHATKRFYINSYADQDGYKTPNSLVIPAIGDSYTIVGIGLPDIYVEEAETALEVATQAFLDENCVPMVVYQIEIDQKFAKTNVVVIGVGDRVQIVDSFLGVDSFIRVSGIEFPLVNPYDIKALIADFVPYTLEERVIKNIVSTKKEKIYVDRKSAELARRNTMRQNQLRTLLFDTDGYFDPVNIKPLSIETLHLSVGAKSQNFRLNNVTIEPNHAGENEIAISAGELIHFEIAISGNYVWTIGSGAIFDSLSPTTPYYLYVKCSQTANTGVWDLSATKKTFILSPDDGYYYFLCGILYPVLDGARDYDFTYGMTYINGRVVTTGRIRSIDGLNYFDLEENQFMLGNGTDKSIDWNVTDAGVLTIKGAIVSDVIMTNVILAEKASIENLLVKLFEGESAGVGNLDGTVETTEGADHVHNVTEIQQRDDIVKNSNPEDCDITINGFTETMIWNTNPATTVSNFVASADFGTGVTLYDDGGGAFHALGSHNMGTPYIGASYGTASTVTAYRAPVAQVETVTLTGDSGRCVIAVAGQTPYIDFNETLEKTATNFADENTLSGITISHSGAKIRFAADVPGTGFVAPVVTNYPTIYNGGLKILGNDIWEDTEDNDDYGTVKINTKGFEGGHSRYRHFIIGNGKDGSLIIGTGEGANGILYLNGDHIKMLHIPSSAVGLGVGEIYKDASNFLKIVV